MLGFVVVVALACQEVGKIAGVSGMAGVKLQRLAVITLGLVVVVALVRQEVGKISGQFRALRKFLQALPVYGFAFVHIGFGLGGQFDNPPAVRVFLDRLSILFLAFFGQLVNIPHQLPQLELGQHLLDQFLHKFVKPADFDNHAAVFGDGGQHILGGGLIAVAPEQAARDVASGQVVQKAHQAAVVAAVAEHQGGGVLE